MFKQYYTKLCFNKYTNRHQKDKYIIHCKPYILMGIVYKQKALTLFEKNKTPKEL